MEDHVLSDAHFPRIPGALKVGVIGSLGLPWMATKVLTRMPHNVRFTPVN
jgi:hypothetical protein